MKPQTIPLWVKLAYTSFVMILVPYYLHAYGPTNFLYFCDVALLLTTVALWSENSLLASASIIGILLPQLLWMVDFIGALTGNSLTGMPERRASAGVDASPPVSDGAADAASIPGFLAYPPRAGQGIPAPVCY